jgi:Flp pilus assembly protein TadG
MTRRTVWRRITTRGDDAGSISLFFVVMTLAFLALIGLVVDGGGRLDAAERADDLAAQAGRQAAQSVRGSSIVGGQDGGIDIAKAQAVAQQVLHSGGGQGQVRIIDPTHLEVNTTVSYAPVVLGIIGIGPQTLHGHAVVNLQTGG